MPTESWPDPSDYETHGRKPRSYRRDIRRTPVGPTRAEELSAKADSQWVRDMSLTRRRFRMAVLRALLDIQELLKERP